MLDLPQISGSGGSGGGAQEAGGSGGSATTSPNPSASFQAILDDGTRFVPNPQGAMGSNHLMTVVSTHVKIQDRSGAELSNVSLESFWSGLGAGDVVDPRLTYDPYRHRFIFVSLSDYTLASPNPGILVAVSRTADPTGLWNRYFIDIDTTRPIYGTSPNIGFNKDWIAVQLNMFSKTTDDFQASDVFVFNKTNLYGGGAGTFTRFVNTDLGVAHNAQVPAVTFDNSLSILYLLANWNSNSDGFGFLRVFSINGTVNSPVFNVGEIIGIQHPATGWDDFAPDDDNFAQQLGTANRVYLRDGRLQNVVYRNSSLWSAHTVFLPGEAPTYSAIQWWEVTPAGATIQVGQIGASFNDSGFGYPSIAVNTNNDVVIGYSRFAPFVYPSAAYAYRMEAADPFSTLRNEVVFKPGEASYFAPDSSGINRWGQWSATVVDPLNDTEFWTLQQYAAPRVGGIDRWGTWWARVSPHQDLSITRLTDTPDPLTAGQNVTYSLTVTNLRPTRVANGALLVDTLPAGAAFVSAVPSQGTCTHQNGIVTCQLGSLGRLGSATISIVATLTASGPNTNVAVLTSNGPELDEVNNRSSVVTTVNALADLAVTQTSTPRPTATGSPMTFNVTVTNRGPSGASAVVLTDTLPAGSTFIDAISSRGPCTRNGNIVTCNLGIMAAGSTVDATITITSATPGNATNRATVTASSADPNNANNTANATNRFNAAPTMQGIANMTIEEDAILAAVPFTVGDAETSAAALEVIASSSNPALVPNGNIALGGTGANRTITVTPLPEQSGTTIITRTVTDADGASSSSNFTLTVTLINDRPTVSNVGNVTTAEDTPTASIGFTVGDVDNDPGALQISFGSSNPSLVAPANIQLGGAGANRSLIITPAADVSGAATITIMASDGNSIGTDTFVLTVDEVNDLPTIAQLGNRDVNEDTPIGPLALAISDVETAAGSLTLLRRSSNPAVVPVGNITFGGSGSARTVTIVPATNASGNSTIDLDVLDAHGGSNRTTFVVNVIAVNDFPTLNPLGGLNLMEDEQLQIVPLSGISSGAPNENDPLVVSAFSSNPDLIPHPVISYNSPDATGTLFFIPVANAHGQATITVTVDDNQSANQFVDRVFTVTVQSVNDRPTITGIANQTIDEDQNTGALSFFVEDADTPVGDLTLTVGSTNLSLVPLTGIAMQGTGVMRSVVVTPLPNQSGRTLISIRVSDGVESATNMFVLTVNPINDPPTVMLGAANISVNEDTMSAPLTLHVSDPETAPAALNVVVQSSAPAIVPPGNVVVVGNGNDRTVTIQPAPNQSGPATLTFSVTDGLAEPATALLQVNVAAVNDPPFMNALNDITVTEGSGARQVALSGIGSGAPDEIQTVTVTATSDNTAVVPHPLVSHTPGNATGNLTFTPQPQTPGIAVITVRMDDGGASNNIATRTFTVNVQPVNDPPALSFIPDQTTEEDVPIQGIPFTVSDPESAASTIGLTAFSGNEELVLPSGIIFAGTGTNRTLNIRPLPNQSGNAVLIIVATDPQGEAQFIDFELHVNPVNDPPVISSIANYVIHEENPNPVVSFNVSDVETPSPNLDVTVEASSSSIFPPGSIVINGVGSDRTLAFTPAAGVFGDTLITIRAKDAQGLTTSNSFGMSVRTGPVLRIGRAGGNAALTWSTNYPNHLLQWSDAMSGAPWNTIMNVPPVVNGRFAQTVAADAAKRFYRLLELQPISLATVLDQTVREDGTVRVTLTFTDPAGIVDAIVLEGISDNPAVVVPGSFVFGGTGVNRFVDITPLPQQSGVAELRVNATDAFGRTVSAEFTLTVVSVNDAPSFAAGGNQSVLEDSGAQSVAAWATAISAGPPNESTQALNFVINNDNNALFSVQPAIDTAGNLTYTPAANAHGTANVTVQLHDNGGVADGGIDMSPSISFTITVRSVNDVPSFVAGGNQAVLEDAGPQVVTGWATAMSAGPPNESLQQLQFLVSNDNSGLFSSAPAINASGGLAYTAAANAHGSASVTVRLRDNGGTTDGGQDTSTPVVFTITVNPVNDAPVFVAGGNQVVLEDSGPRVVANWATGISAGAPNESGQVLTFAINNDNAALFSVAPMIDSAGQLTFTPASNIHGTANLTVQLRDNGGTVNGGQDVSAAVGLSITVISVNDPPGLDPLTPLTIDEDAGATNVILTGISSGAANEPGLLVVDAISGNSAIISSVGVTHDGSSSTALLTFTPVANANGSVAITVRVNDQGSSNNIVTRTLDVTVRSVNDLPTMTTIAPQTINEDEPTLPLAFTIGDVETAVGSLVITRASSNTNLIHETNIVVSGTGPARTVVVRPSTNQVGTALISLVVRDADNGATTNTFTVTVLAVPDAPTITPINAQVINEDASTAALPFTIADADTAVADLLVQVVSSNSTLVPPGGINVIGNGAVRTITITPAAEQSGVALITVFVSDGTATNSASFQVTVNLVDDPPTLAVIANQQVMEDNSVSVQITVGDIDTAVGSLTATAVSSNQALVANSSLAVTGNGATRTLVITPVTNQFGAVMIGVTVSDGVTPVTRAFQLTITGQNDPPTLTAITDRTINEDAGLQTVNLTGISAGPGGESGNVTVTATSSNPGLINGVNVVHSNPNTTGSLTFTPVANANGVATITVRVDDGQANGVLVRTFKVTVNAAEDPPSISNIANVTTLEDTPVSIPFGIADIDTAPFQLALVVSSSTTNVISVGGIFLEGNGTNRVITIAPEPDQFGQSTITIGVTDGVTTNSDTFVVTVAAVNDPPTLDPIANVGLVVNGGDYSVNFSGVTRGPANETTGNLVPAASTLDSGIVSIRTRTYTTPATSGIQRIRPGNGAGVTAITMTFSDSQGSNNLVNRTFQAYVRAANNNPPTISALANRTIPEDGSTGVINFTVGDAETAAASLSVAASSSNGRLVPPGGLVLGGSGASRTLTVTPAPNENGTAVITVQVTDAGFGMTLTNFNLTVTSGNDTPFISLIGSQSMAMNGSTSVVPFTVSDVETPAARLNVSASSSVPSLIPHANVVLGGTGTNRALRITPAPNQSGTAMITITVSDGQGGSNTSIFQVTVLPVEGPMVKITRVGSTVARISWPTSFVGYTLQSRDELSGVPVWTNVPATPTIAGSDYIVDVPSNVGNRFYRLNQ